ncbi:ABC transporter permease [Agromyces badenianii]|uniref:ABC transporter permease n=1 Tax=Agromyces badenianii TaxID=2080742 RepID=A0A2S0WTP7_9MICO|nr:ABC transporter permease [Agromyces badenianii]AWB94682.1 ABC transporter permease [Agromyces badenianii]PWC03521.1 ABC transporter permease [Agromyces badenianii]
MTTTSGPRLDTEPARARSPWRGPGSVAERRSGIPALIGQRLIQIPAVLLVVSVLVFWLVQVVPGDPGRNALGPHATAAQVQLWNAQHGVDGSLPERYLGWLAGFATGQWGESLVYSQPVAELVLPRLANSMLLGGLAFALLVPAALAVGGLQAYREGTRTDRALTTALMSLAALPEFVIGVLLLIVFAVVLAWVPVQSATDATADPLLRLRAMILPAVTLAVGYFAVIARMVRTGVIDTLGAQYHRTAVLKGLRRGQVLRRHVARNALIPTISLLGIYLGTLLGGSAIVETLFGYPGLGALLVTATEKKDILLLEAGVMVTGAVSLIALLLTDLAFVIVDPRIRFEKAE